MEGPYEYPAARFAGLFLHPLPHFPAGLIGKGQAQDFLRQGPLTFQDAGNATSQRIRLAGSRRRQQQDILIQLLHRLALRFI